MAIPGLSGSLLSADALAGAIPEALGPALDRAGAAAIHSRIRAWHRRVSATMGPATSARALFDRLAVPFLTELGFTADIAPVERGGLFRGILEGSGHPCAALIVTPWGGDAGSAWREGVLHGIASGLRWCFCITGPALRVLDARRTYSRRFAQFDLERAIEDPAAFAAMWGLLRAAAFVNEPLLDRAVALSERHRASVRVSLQEGVHDALTELLRAFSRARRSRRNSADVDAWFDDSLVVVYRVLFLLFAEARGLVPRWHPVYRDSYTIESLRPRVERRRSPLGLWEALQAISRLAHHGCRAGSLAVPPFNGRLFSPAHAPLAEALALDDGAVRQALLALTTRNAPAGRERIAYSDLGVEQLGGVYERVLDFAPAFQQGGIALVRTGQRKATGSFYTPRSITEYLVRRTLGPLVRERSAGAILQLRVLDPSMGSGAFLVAACRYLATAYEQALVADGGMSPSDVTDADRACFRRTIAQRCLFGVDVNPMAVQLGRLSLWLASLASDRPLTFLDHHLRAGNSLVGASMADAMRQPPGGGRAVWRQPLPLFAGDEPGGALREVVAVRLGIAEEPGDTIDDVRSKERAFARLARGGPLSGWMRVADLWCAGWFGVRVSRGLFGALADELLGCGGGAKAAGAGRDVVARASEAAARERFFHWTLEFPEVFFDESGAPLPRPGFDAVIGNPPWDVVQGVSHLTGFARGSGIYIAQGDGHANLYQLFLERALSLVATGGRIGMVLPSGFGSDHGSARLRRLVLDKATVDSFVSLENRDGVFPIHRSLKFLLLTATRGTATAALPCRFGVRSLEVLDRLPDDVTDPGAIHMPREMLERVGGREQLAIPELRTVEDADITARVSSAIPPLADGWNAHFGRELNASDDRPHFVTLPGAGCLLRVLEGKQIQPFTVDAGSARFGIRRSDAARRLPSRPFDRARLAYRDVASPTNRLTLIAAVVPAGAVTTHTLFCLKEALDATTQHYLCAVLNSYVANYLVRMRVGTHVTVSIVERLPVPAPSRDSRRLVELAQLAERLATSPGDAGTRARAQAIAASLYGLSTSAFRHVLDTFPLVAIAERREAALAFEALTDTV